MTKTVAVICVLCGWEGRRHRTEMERIQWNRAKCPACGKGSVVYASPKPRVRKATIT